jgi:hypothetical protein
VLVEGAGGSLPEPPALQDAFGQSTAQRPGGGFPIARLLGLVRAGTGVLLKLAVAPLLSHDLARGPAVQPRLHPGEVPVAARGRCASAPLARLAQAGVHAGRGVGARPMVAFTPGRPFVRPGGRRTPAVKGGPRSRWRRALGVHDQRVTGLNPKPHPSGRARETWAALPEAFILREVRSQMGPQGVRTRQGPRVTTLRDAAVSQVDDRAELYRQRWRIETALAQLKTTMPMGVWHGQTVPGVLQERAVCALVYHLVRPVMWPAAVLQHLNLERISFLDARRWFSAPRSGLPLGGLIVNPVRPPRVAPRVKKRRPKSFPFMIKPR